MDIADQNLMGMDSFGGSTYAPQRSMNQPPMYGMGGMPFGGGYGGFGGFGGGYGGGFNPMFGGIGGLGFNPMFGPGFGQPMSPFGGGIGGGFGAMPQFGGFGGYPQFGGFGGGFGGYPQFGGFGGFSPMFGGIGGLGYNPFMGPDFGRRMPQRDMRQELFGNLKKPQPAVKQVPEDIGHTMEDFPQVEDFKSDPDAQGRDYMYEPAGKQVLPVAGSPAEESRDHGPRDYMYRGASNPMSEIMAMLPASSRIRSETNLPAAPADQKWQSEFMARSGARPVEY